MILHLKRITKQETYTIGRLEIDGEYFCDTIEDKDRGLYSSMPIEQLKGLKVYGKTAIPTGTYKIDMQTVSQKFKDRTWARPFGGKLPRLVNVPGYDGVLIHVGNTADDTLGCILVGRATKPGYISESTKTFNRLMDILCEASCSGDNIFLQIT